MKPPKSILDPAFKYTSSVNTNIKETFERVRKEPQPKSNVKPLRPAAEVSGHGSTPSSPLKTGAAGGRPFSRKER